MIPVDRHWLEVERARKAVIRDARTLIEVLDEQGHDGDRGRVATAGALLRGSLRILERTEDAEIGEQVPS